MKNGNMNGAVHIESISRPNESVRRFESNLPLEIVTLLDVFSRIEIRRQKRLYDNRKAVI
jgi:hypothetical protein